MVMKLKTHEATSQPDKVEREEEKDSLDPSPKRLSTHSQPSTLPQERITRSSESRMKPMIHKDPDLPSLTAQNRRTDRQLLPRRG